MANRHEKKAATGRHRAADETGDITTSRGEARRASPRPHRSRINRQPVQIIAPRSPRAPAPTRTAPSPAAPARRSGGNSAALASAANAYANRQALRASSSKPSITGRAASGAAAGAAAGGALGGPVGTAVGGGVGAVAGGVAGARAKREYRASMRPNPGLRRLLVAEFTVCMVVVALSPMTDDHKSDKPGEFMKRMTALMGVFFVLALVSAAGRGGAKVATGFGGLITVALMVSERDLFTRIAGAFNAPAAPGGGGGTRPDVGTQTGDPGADMVPAGGA